MPVLFFALLLSNPVVANGTTKKNQMDIEPGTYQLSLWVINIDSKEEFLAAGMTSLCLPGSIIKFFPGSYLMESIETRNIPLIGTRLYQARTGQDNSCSDLYVSGEGNASLTVHDINKSISRLELRNEIGNVIVDDHFFDGNTIGRQRKGPSYTPPGALGFDLNTVNITVIPTEAGKVPNVAVNPTNNAVQIVNTAQTSASNATTIEIKQINDTTYKIMGFISVDGSPVSKRFSLQDPALFAGGVLKSILEEKEIEVTGKVKRGTVPNDAELLAEIPGPPLNEMLTKMNHHSLNVVADNLLLAIGAERFGPPGTREKGVMAIEGFLNSLNLPMNEIEIYDGSGLSDKNRITTNFMTRFLIAISKKPWFEDFKKTFPRPGYDGTVKNLSFKDERFRIKSGRLEDVYALAGYGVDATGQDVAFTFIVNGTGAGVVPYMDQVGSEVLEYIANTTFIDSAVTPHFQSRLLH
jgi:D-alanyl-D-alanine carboxypeptidase/D-alanyl-D-alanine-endopeptidase (penicillin-binding protein 4)